jgi:hypothetical protein
MSDKTLKVEPWGEGQGEFVVIDADSFDESVHKLFVEKELSAKDKKSSGDGKNSQ